jgi:hypothetical protein
VNRAQQQQQQPYFKASTIDVSQRAGLLLYVYLSFNCGQKEIDAKVDVEPIYIIYSTHKMANNPYRNYM